MTRKRSRCSYTSCTRFARAGHDRCTAHRNAVDRKGNPPTQLEHQLAGQGFGKLTPLVLQTAADAGDGVDNEIAILRATMLRLIDNEPDASKQAQGVAKLAGTIIQAMRAKKTLTGETADQFTDAVALILEEINQ